MISLDQARAHVAERCGALAPRRGPVADALGLVLAADVVATEAVPPFANTAMDGFALRAADTRSAPVELDVVGTIAAGDPGDIEVAPGTAARIMTGAPMPPGADAVVMVERTRQRGDRVTVEVSVEAGNHVRGPGEDVTPGQTIARAGQRCTPGLRGVLASVGVRDVLAHPRPRVGAMSTGDELVGDGSALGPGQIRDSNRLTLLGLLAADDLEPVDLGLGRDDPDELAVRVRDAVGRCDAVLTSGGVSVGDFDHMTAVLGALGDVRWMQIAIKPAKPFAFGTVDGVPVFGLPGNPVSSMVSYELLARPGLRRLAGSRRPERATVSAVAGEDLGRHPDAKTHYLRVVSSRGDGGELVVRSAGGQGSHVLHAMAAADALAVLPDGHGVVAGETVQILRLRDPDA